MAGSSPTPCPSRHPSLRPPGADGLLLGGRTVLPLRPEDPHCIGPARLLHRFPPGGQGCDVFAGSLHPGGVPVVVKRLPAGSTVAARRAFEQEVALTGRVRDARLAVVYQADLQAEAAWYVQSRLPGAPLTEVLHRSGGRLGQGVVENPAAEVLRALDAVHAAGVVHGDVKPANLLVDGARAFLVDFGAGRDDGADDDATVTMGARLGTRGYASPEHFRVDLPIGPAADLFSWGLVVLRMLAGRHPIDPAGVLTDREYYRALIGFRLAPGTVAGGLGAAVGRALAVRPGERGTAAQLLGLVAGGPTSRRPGA